MNADLENIMAEQFEFSHTPIDVAKYRESPFERGRTKVIESLLPVALSGMAAVDVGCGPGHFSRILSKQGWAVTSIDTDPQNLAATQPFVAATRLGDAISVLQELPPENYDLALALELIEHMPKSLGQTLLTALWKVLKPGGELLLSTPNRFSMEGLVGYYWGEKLRKWDKWNAWDATHVHIYSTQEIIKLLKQCGFTVSAVTGYWYEADFPVIGHSRLPLAVSQRFPLNRMGFNLILKCRK